MEIKTTITCHSCDRKIEIEWKNLPSESDVASNLERMGWAAKSTKNDTLISIPTRLAILRTGGGIFDICPDCLNQKGSEL
jgi:hypothetical protein